MKLCGLFAYRSFTFDVDYSLKPKAMEKKSKMIRCRVSASYCWKKGRVRHLKTGSFEVELPAEEVARLKSDPAARIELFKQHISPLDEISRNEVLVEIL